MARSIRNALKSTIRANDSKPEATVAEVFDVAEGSGHFGYSHTLPNSNSIVAGIVSRIASDLSAYRMDYYRFTDDEKGHKSDHLDENLVHALKYAPNPTQSPSQFLSAITREMLEHGVAVVFLDGSSSLKFPALRVGRLLNYSSFNAGIEMHRIGGRGSVPSYEVEFFDESKAEKVTRWLPLDGVVVIKNPNPDLKKATQPLIGALNEAVNNVAERASRSRGGLVGIIKSVARSTNTEKIEQTTKRLQKFADAAASSETGIGYLGPGEEYQQLTQTNPEQANATAVESLLKLVYGVWGISPAIIDGTATADELNQYRTGTLEPLRNAIEEGLNQLLGYELHQQGHRIRLSLNALRLMTPATLAQYGLGLINSTAITPDDFRDYGLGLSRLGGTSALLFNRNNSTEHAITDTTTQTGVNVSDLTQGGDTDAR